MAVPLEKPLRYFCQLCATFHDFGWLPTLGKRWKLIQFLTKTLALMMWYYFRRLPYLWRLTEAELLTLRHLSGCSCDRHNHYSKWQETKPDLKNRVFFQISFFLVTFFFLLNFLIISFLSCTHSFVRTDTRQFVFFPKETNSLEDDPVRL